ncbi:MAG: hypothetical protein GXY36_13155 [Chloroflexi bacterium]|nr:hypothetical protein [Chloroflexota bacterium]
MPHDPADRQSNLSPNPGDGHHLSPREQMQRAEEALIELRQKMAQVAAEYAEGRLNRAQFEAVYGRYSEQRDITERLLARNPESQAWQSVIQPGHTGFLRSHYAARVLSYAIYDQRTAEVIHVSGTTRLEDAQIAAVLRRLTAIMAERGNPGPTTRRTADDHCVLFVPGELTIAIVIFLLEPAGQQIQRVSDLHRDFERANWHALANHDYEPERLVFPHRALLEDQRF